MFHILYTDSYNKRAARFLRKHQHIKSLSLKVLQLLEVNPYHPSLRLYALAGNLKGLYSISINLKYRITLEFIIDDKKIIPVNIGTHDAVY